MVALGLVPGAVGRDRSKIGPRSVQRARTS